MKPGLAAVLGVLLASAAVPIAVAEHEDPRVARADYDLAPPGPVASSSVPTPLGTFDVGGTTMAIQDGEDSVEVFLLDDTTLDVPGRIVFYDDQGGQLVVDEFCFTTERSIPATATNVTVRPSPSVHPCPLASGTGPAIRGEILFTFRG